MDKPRRQYWLHRITGGENARPVAVPLLKNERYLSIGWSFLSTDEYASDIQERGIDAINEAYAIQKADLSPNRHSLKRFIHDMHAGDYVVVPFPGEFSVFEIADETILSNESNQELIMIDWNGNVVMRDGNELYNSKGEHIDLGFYRRVIPIEEHINRNDYAHDALKSRLRILQTNADISDLWEEIEDAIIAHKSQAPINVKGELLQNEVDDLQKLISFNKILREYVNMDNPTVEKTLQLANQMVDVLGVNVNEKHLLQRIGLGNMRFLDTALQGTSSGYVILPGSQYYTIGTAVQLRLTIKQIFDAGIKLYPLSLNADMIKQSISIEYDKWYTSDIVLRQDEHSYTRNDILGKYILQTSHKEDSRKQIFDMLHSGITHYDVELPFVDDPIEVSLRQIIYEMAESFRIEGILDITDTDELLQHIQKAQALFIKSLSIQNYKLFDTYKKLEFRDRFTVIIGDNAKGKTTVLSAIRLLLDSMLPSELNHTSGHTYYGFDGSIPLEDVNREILLEGGVKYNFPVDIYADFSHFGRVSRIRRDEDSKTQKKNRKLEEYFAQVTKSGDENMRYPLLSYCGTDRTKSIETTKARNKLYNNRYDGYNSCLETHCSTAYLRLWLRDLQHAAKQNNRSAELLESFVNAICGCFREERIVKIEYAYWESQTSKNKKSKIDDIILTQEDTKGKQKRLLLRSMSAGYQSMVGLIADLAFRCICLNPQLGKDAIIGTTGIVLIDEIDMHLHPSWQRHIVDDLMHCFPKLQFIVTTHSPFVVQSLKKEQICNFAKEKVICDPQNENLATNAYLMGIESDRSIRFKKQEDDAYDFLEAIKKENITVTEIDEMMKRYALLYSDNPAYVAKLRIETGKAKNAILYKSLVDER